MRDAGCGMRDAGCGMRDAGCGMRALRIPHPALVKVAECGLRNQARLPFSASVLLSFHTILVDI